MGCFLLFDQISNILTFKIPAEILEVSSALSSVLLSKFNPSLVNFIINKEKFQIQLLAVLGGGSWLEMFVCWCDWIMTGLVTYLSLVSAIH